jgi:hypothetical protein
MTVIPLHTRGSGLPYGSPTTYTAPYRLAIEGRPTAHPRIVRIRQRTLTRPERMTPRMRFRHLFDCTLDPWGFIRETFGSFDRSMRMSLTTAPHSEPMHRQKYAGKRKPKSVVDDKSDHGASSTHDSPAQLQDRESRIVMRSLNRATGVPRSSSSLAIAPSSRIR